MDKTQKKLSVAGKKGANVRYARRIKVLAELYQEMAKLELLKLYVTIQHARTEYLEALLDAYKKNKDEK